MKVDVIPALGVAAVLMLAGGVSTLLFYSPQVSAPVADMLSLIAVTVFLGLGTKFYFDHTKKIQPSLLNGFAFALVIQVYYVLLGLIDGMLTMMYDIDESTFPESSPTIIFLSILSAFFVPMIVGAYMEKKQK